MDRVLDNDWNVGKDTDVVVVRHLQESERKIKEERTLGAGGEIGAFGRERERWVETWTGTAMVL